MISIGLGLGLTRGGGRVHVFTPADLSSLLFWADFTKAAGTISSLSDAAGSGRTITSTGANRPAIDGAVTLNGKTGAKFTASQYLQTTTGGVTGAAAHSMAAVMQLDATSGYALMIMGQTAAGFSALGTYGSATNGWWWGHFVNGSGLQGQYYNGTSDTSPHLICKTFDGTAARLYVDGYLQAPKAGQFANPQTDSGYNSAAGFGIAPHSAGFLAPAHVFEAVWTAATMTAGERRTYEQRAAALYGSTLGAAAARLPQVIYVGDSNTLGLNLSAGQDYPSVCTAALSKSVTAANLGVTGRTAATMAGSAQEELDVCRHTTGLAPTNVALLMAGTNDLYTGSTAATTEGYVQTWHQQAKALSPGLRTVAMTILPSADVNRAGTFDAQRLLLNAWIAANWSSFADAFLDVANIAGLTDPNGSNFQADHLHLSATGAAILGAAAATVVNGMI